MSDTLDIGIDLDGVTYDFVGALRTYLHRTTGRPLSSMPEPTTWAFYETDWDMTLDEFLSTSDQAVRDGFMFTHGLPLPGAADGMRYLHRHGHRLHIITDRLSMGPVEMVKAATAQWLHDWDIPYTTLTFSPNKAIIRTDAFIDDKPENYHTLINAGTDTFLRHYQYNAHVPAPTNRRVHSFTDFVHGLIGEKALAHAE